MEKTGNYELLYIVHPDLEGTLEKVVSKVKGFIESRDGKITYEEDWGKKKLAYEINKTDVGIYILWYFEIPKDKVAGIEKDLKITEEVMRFMILKIEDKPKKEVKKTTSKKANEEKTEKKASPKNNEVSGKSETESEKERMEKLDEKLGELLEGEEDDTKDEEVKASEEKKEKGGKK